MTAFLTALTLVPAFVALGSLVFGLVWWTTVIASSKTPSAPPTPE